MSKLRMEFEKGPDVAFISHLELMKVFAQAIRRAGIPVAWSEGFNPRPKLSFSSAIATGMTSRRECMDLELTEDRPAGQVMESLNRMLPPGLTVHRARLLEGKTKSLMALMQFSDYRVHLAVDEPLPADRLAQAVRRFLERPEVMWTVHSPRGTRIKDLRPGILRLEACADGRELVLDWTLKAGSEGNIRPEHATGAFLDSAGIGGQGPLKLDKTAVYGRREEEQVSLFDL